MYFLNSNYSPLFGVIGTLLGVVLGFILNHISRIGRIKIFQNSLSVQFTEQCNETGQELLKAELTDKTSSITILVNFDFYNSSSQSPKIARDIKFIALSNGTSLSRDLIKDSKNDKIQFASNNSEARNLNLSPKSVVSYELSFFSRKYFQIFLDSEWYLEFRNDRNKIRRIKIDKGFLKKRINLSELFRNRKEFIVYKG